MRIQDEYIWSKIVKRTNTIIRPETISDSVCCRIELTIIVFYSISKSEFCCRCTMIEFPCSNKLICHIVCFFG